MIGNPPSLQAFFEIWRRNAGGFLHYEGDIAALRLTYQQAANAAIGFAAKLRAANIHKGDRILLWAENRPEWVVVL